MGNGDAAGHSRELALIVAPARVAVACVRLISGSVSVEIHVAAPDRPQSGRERADAHHHGDGACGECELLGECVRKTLTVFDCAHRRPHHPSLCRTNRACLASPRLERPVLMVKGDSRTTERAAGRRRAARSNGHHKHVTTA
jgi:hypothetical protein